MRLARHQRLYRCRWIDTAQGEVRGELPRFRRKSDATRRGLGNRGKLDHALGALVDAEPENSRSSGVRKRPQLGEANIERRPASRRLEPLHDLVAVFDTGRTEKPKREMPILRRYGFARQSLRQRPGD